MDRENVRDELKEEYKILQAHYENFDARALMIKSWSAPILTAAIGLGVSNSSKILIISGMLAAAILWWLEVTWKSFQYCYISRIELIEEHFRSGSFDGIEPFQIFQSWLREWRRYYGHNRNRWRIVKAPFVFLPYLPVIVFGLLAIVFLWIP